MLFFLRGKTFVLNNCPLSSYGGYLGWHNLLIKLFFHYKGSKRLVGLSNVSQKCIKWIKLEMLLGHSFGHCYNSKGKISTVKTPLSPDHGTSSSVSTLRTRGGRLRVVSPTKREYDETEGTERYLFVPSCYVINIPSTFFVWTQKSPSLTTLLMFYPK